MTRIEKLHATGIRRLGSPRRGFRYRTADGKKPSAADRERIEGLVLPPAWKDVAINASPSAALQAVGRDVKRNAINQYIKEVMGKQFTAKDFRTWVATLFCASALWRAGADPAESRTARKHKVVEAIRNTATLLGNTPAVCRKSYISSSVLSSFDRGRTIAHNFRTVGELLGSRRGLHAAEKDVLRLLKQKAA